jgi:hypothetical protein
MDAAQRATTVASDLTSPAKTSFQMYVTTKAAVASSIQYSTLSSSSNTVPTLWEYIQSGQVTRDLEMLLETLGWNIAHVREEVIRQQQTFVQLLQEQEKINSRIKGIQELKKLKMKATVLIVLFLRKKVLPMLRKRRYLRDKNNLAHVIRGAVVRKQYKTTLRRRHEAANSMQKLIRGRLHRKLVKNLHTAAQVIQCAFRAWLGRRLRQVKMLQVLAKLKYKRALAAIKIQCFARIWKFCNCAIRKTLEFRC